MFTVLLEKLHRRQDLTTDEAAAAMGEIIDGRARPSEIAGLLVALRMKSLAIHSAGRANGNPMIRLGSPLSLPIAASLGAQPSQKLEYPVWLVQDFATATGEVLAESGGG